MKKGKAIVVFSGGQDSTTCLYWALNRFEEVQAITFNYGQKHDIEIQQAAKILERVNVKQIIVDLNQSLGFLAESALFQSNSEDVGKVNKYGLPSSFVPGRNGIFLYNAFVYALKVGADSIITGVCQTDYSGYPDCRREFINLLLDTMKAGVFGEKRHEQGVCDLTIETPLMYLTKAETFKLAKDEGCLNEVIVLSHTCYNGQRTFLHSWGWSSENGYDTPF
jgi:7-cyano-7-deazaguanine synthase